MGRRVLLAAAAIVALGLSGLVVFSRWSRDDGIDRADIGASTIVLLGDSITEGGEWSYLLDVDDVANRGYAGFTTAELHDVARAVVEDRPAAVLIMTGTNDIRDGHPPRWTTSELGPILDLFRQRSPETTVVIQTVLPRADAVAEVVAINEQLVALAERRGLRLLDLYPVFDDGNGGLRPAETTDGIHLARPGYEVWAEQLNELLAAGL